MYRIKVTVSVLLVSLSALFFGWSFAPPTETSRNQDNATRLIASGAVMLPAGSLMTPENDVSILHALPSNLAQRTISSADLSRASNATGSNTAASSNAVQLMSANAQPPDTSVHVLRNPTESHLIRAGRDFRGDLRQLPDVKPVQKERPEHEPPSVVPVPYPGSASTAPTTASVSSEPAAPSLNAPAPSPIANFDGLDFANWGAGHPPDTNGDVGPTYYIQTINTSIGIFRKIDGVRVAAFTFNSFFNGHFGNLCDTNNFGDPVVLYDTFEDRWIITDFAFLLSGGNPA